MRNRIRREIDSAIFNRYHHNSSAGHGQGGEEGIEGLIISCGGLPNQRSLRWTAELSQFAK